MNNWPEQLGMTNHLIDVSTESSVGVQLTAKCDQCGAVLKTIGGAKRHNARHVADYVASRKPL